MKKNITRIILPLIFMLLFNGAQAQDKNTFMISADLYHSWPIIYRDNLDEFGYYRPLVNPGVEVLYFNQKIINGNLGAGLFYQRSRFGAHELRFRIQELSIPLVYKRRVLISKKRYILTTGIYNGLLIKSSVDFLRSNGWRKSRKASVNHSNSIVDGYFTDLYTGLGCPIKGKLGDFNLAAYFKYRINSTWVNNFDRNIYLGIKLSYFLTCK